MPDVIDKMMSFISGDGENDSDKDILLKQLSKEISQNKYAKYYRARQQEVDITLGQYFFSVYKLIYPLQQFLKDPAREAKIKQITLEAFLDKQTMELIKRLTPDSIAERKKIAGDELTKQLQEDIANLSAGFDTPKIATADKCHNQITYMKQFLSFDFCSFLQKFDPDIKAGDFVTIPKFSPVDIKILSSEISAFLSVLPLSEEAVDWKIVFEILKYCKGGTDVIPLAQWNSLLASLKDLKQSKILELVNKLATGNPILEVKITEFPNESLSSGWLEQKIREIREIITGIASNQRNTQINTLEQAVFGPLAKPRLTYYIPEKGRALTDKGLEGYTLARALNHLTAFIQEYLSKEIQELCDLFLVRGQWTNNAASRAMSEGFHDALEVAKEITELDESLAEAGSNGPRIRGSLLRVDRDKSQARYLNNIIIELNENALNIIKKTVPSLIVVGKHFKMLLDDCERKPFELIMNWKELTGLSKVPMPQRLEAIYKKINYFVQLMMLETREAEKEH